MFKCPYCPSYLNTEQGRKSHITRLHRNHREGGVSTKVGSREAAPTVTNLVSTEKRPSSQTYVKELDEDNPNQPLTEKEDALKEVFEALHYVRTLRRVPKGARFQVAQALVKVINAVLEDSEDILSWVNLFAFSSCLASPEDKEGKSLTAKVKSQVQAFEDWCCYPLRKPYDPAHNFLDPRRKSASKTAGSNLSTERTGRSLAAIITKKISNYDIRGAARLASTSESLASVTKETVDILRSLHPTGADEDLIEDSQSGAPFHFVQSDLAYAIRHFQRGTAAGPDGLSADVLKDLTSCTTGNSQLLSERLVALVNLVVAGGVPVLVRPYFFGANLLPISKAGGGIRPIAVGNVFRRICSKLCARKGLASLPYCLTPHQMGCGAPSGAESIVHAARSFVEDAEVLVKLDFKNAFNSMKRSVFLNRVREDLPGLYNYTRASYGRPSLLFVANNGEGERIIIPSAEGVQQGDPLGPFLFSLGIHPMVNKLNCPLNAWYLDDGAVGGTLKEVVEDLEKVTEDSKEMGLILNTRKSEVFINAGESSGNGEECKNVIGKILADPIYLSRDSFILLGAPVFPEATDQVLHTKLSELKRLTNNLKSLDAHDAIFLLKHCYNIPKLTHVLRSSMCFGRNVLLEFDSVLREALERILNIALCDRAWEQATLPSYLGGLGIRRTTEVALPAYLASSFGSRSLSNSLITAEGQGRLDALVNVALACWTHDSRPEPSKRRHQREWDLIQCNVRADQLLNTSDDMVDRARLLAVRSPHANDWIEAIPATQLGLKLNETQLRITVAQQLGAPIFHPHKCKCGADTDRLGHHGLSCKRGDGRYRRHEEVNDLIRRALQSAGVPAVREPAGLSRDDGKKPDGVTTVPWERGRPIVWDFTCRDTLAPSHVPRTCLYGGAAAQDAEVEKKRKYAGLSSDYMFVPVASETMGGWGPLGLNFLKNLGKRLFQATGEPRSSSFLFQRLSAAIKRGNVESVTSCVPQGKGLEEIFLL